MVCASTSSKACVLYDQVMVYVHNSMLLALGLLSFNMPLPKSNKDGTNLLM